MSDDGRPAVSGRMGLGMARQRSWRPSRSIR